MPNIQLLFFDAGGGHRSAATALQTACSQSHPHWRIELVNIGKLLEPLDFFHKYAGIAGEDIYNKILQHGLTLGAVGMLRATQKIVRLNERGIRRLMGDYWERTSPDLVVSLIPNFNRPLFQALARVLPDTPYMTVMTDMADFPPSFWIEPQLQYVVCGSSRAVEQARKAGYSEAQIRKASGMILQPHFYEQHPVDVAMGRQELGLDPKLATALVLFGGHGAQVMEDIYEKLQASRMPVQGIFICGKNERLARDLAKRRGSMPMHVEGFTREVPRFMRLADFFIGKPGPGSISEAIHMNLPVIVQRNAWTLPQERYNTDWVEEHRVGIVVRGFREVTRAVGHLLEGNRLDELRANARAICNRAVFEVPEMMDDIMALGPARNHLPPPALSRV
ncbi:MAG: galactosyldiacylglycerol synthase [Bryobacterales bacterium]|nr:galactosyldiacylglycerol synthase [Bryobacterales bacterium]